MIKILYKNEPYWVKFTDCHTYHRSKYTEHLYVKRTGFWSFFKKYKKIDQWTSPNNKICETYLGRRIEKYLVEKSPEVPQHIIKCSPEIEELYK